jgi:large subunit ribosomal protein L24
MHVKSDDKVIIRAGKDKGFTGEVLDVDRDEGKVKVAGRNMIVQHTQPRPMLDEPGERVETEGWIDSSNVALYSEERDGPVRTGHQFVGDGGELYDTKKEAVESFDGQVPSPIQKVRVSKQTDEVFDEIEPY